MSSILLAHGLAPEELAEELKTLAPYTQRSDVAQVTSQLIELDAQELLEIEDAISFVKYKRVRQRGKQVAAAEQAQRQRKRRPRQSEASP